MSLFDMSQMDFRTFIDFCRSRGLLTESDALRVVAETAGGEYFRARQTMKYLMACGGPGSDLYKRAKEFLDGMPS